MRWNVTHVRYRIMIIVIIVAVRYRIMIIVIILAVRSLLLLLSLSKSLIFSLLFLKHVYFLYC